MTKQKIKKLSRFGVAAFLLFALTATPIILGCGKKAPPKPPKASSTKISPA